VNHKDTKTTKNKDFKPQKTQQMNAKRVVFKYMILIFLVSWWLNKAWRLGWELILEG
jgi:hypothetical protein